MLLRPIPRMSDRVPFETVKRHKKNPPAPTALLAAVARSESTGAVKDAMISPPSRIISNVIPLLVALMFVAAQSKVSLSTSRMGAVTRTFESVVAVTESIES